jgi:hypothetical protein
MSEPLTDEDLAHVETIAGPWTARSPETQAQAALVLRLVAEVRRLRSDEWLEAAAGEMGYEWLEHWAPEKNGGKAPSVADCTAEALLILRKHRDGKA